MLLEATSVVSMFNIRRTDMAKRKPKKKTLTANQQAYMKEYNRIKRFITRNEKRGFIWNIYNFPPKMPTRVTKKMIDDLKYLTADRLYGMSKTVDQETGEILPGIRLLDFYRSQAAKKAAKTKKARQAAEQAFWTGEQAPQEESVVQPTQPIQPSSGGAADGGLTIYYNVVEGYLKKLEEPVPDVISYNGKKKYRQQRVVEELRTAKLTLLNYIRGLEQKMGKSKLGWLFYKHQDELSMLLDALIYNTSSSSGINTAVSEIIAILNEQPLTMQQAKDLAEQDEYNEDWEEPE